MTTAKQNIVQYYVVNEQLGMSPGKIAAQAAHAATMMMVHYLLNDTKHREAFEAWFAQGQTKIVLRAPEEVLQKLGEEGFVSIRDAGHTEIPAGSLTVVVLPPMEKEAARRYVGGLKLY
ncbi:aminoacyl-tRNA hydrolase [Brevibacillus migulae]|uniref:aminoacyl-tRNA hydrolase n=1 Tax=Brevibacillus migulae TaxID=1644114 RepID=UPI00106DFF31|nr:aminoacyl-tRNA hydrolase [Brevibacillus migulae]